MRDTALTLALAASIGYAVIIGVVSTSEPGASLHREAYFEVRYAGTGRVVQITHPREVDVVNRWLDTAFANPRGRLDFKWYSPPSNELIAHLPSGETTTIFFSGKDPEADESMSRWEGEDQPEGVLLQHEGNSYVGPELPDPFYGHIDDVTRSPEPGNTTSP